jgi:hypothetical protein
VEVRWGEPSSPQWQSSLRLEDVKGLTLDGITGRQAGASNGPGAAIVLDRVEDVVVRHSFAAPGTGTFLRVLGPRPRRLSLHGNDLSRAVTPVAGAAK